jgi:PAS domain S-box-containing protein
MVISKDGERILAWNHAFLRLSGYAQTDIDLHTPADLFHDEAGQEALERVLGCKEGEDLRIEDVPIKTHEGTIQHIDVHVQAIGPSYSSFLLIGEPTSVRQEVQDHRRAERERLGTWTEMSKLILEDALAALPSALKLVERQLGASTVGIYRVSPTSPDYIKDGTLPEVFPAFLPAAEISPLSRNRSWSLGQRPDHPLFSAARDAGLSMLHCSPLGEPTAWVGLFVAGWHDKEAMPEDIEENMAFIANLCHVAIQLSLQRATLAETEKSLNQIEAAAYDQFEGVTDTLLTLDENLRVIRANQAIARLLGYNPAEVADLPVQDVLVGPEDVTASFLDALGHQRVAEQSRVLLHRRDGSPLPVHLRIVPFSEKAKARLLVILRDQSEQQLIEDQTESLAQRALLGEVMAIFAHEVRNPINNISTGVQLVAKRLGKESPLYDSVLRVHKECSRLDQLMNDVLFFSRPLELRIQPLVLSELMNRILTRWKPRFSQAGITCHTAYNSDTPLVLADSRTLEQVVVNLITNAVEAMAEGGTISVNIESIMAHSESMVELKIADTGPGIPPDVVDRIFDPFFTTKKDGTGLGLAISRRILVAHQGTIHVESFADAGTVFSISLPTAKPSGGSTS